MKFFHSGLEGPHFLSLIETPSHVIPVTFDSDNMFNCSLSYIGSWGCSVDNKLVPQKHSSHSGAREPNMWRCPIGHGWNQCLGPLWVWDVVLQGQNTSSIAPLEIDFLRAMHSSRFLEVLVAINSQPGLDTRRQRVEPLQWNRSRASFQRLY